MDTKKILSSFINSSIDRNAVAASEAIQSVLSHKVSQALSARKTELTGGLFKESVSEEVIEEDVELTEEEYETLLKSLDEDAVAEMWESLDEAEKLHLVNVKRKDWFNPTDMRSEKQQKDAYMNHLAAKAKMTKRRKKDDK